MMFAKFFRHAALVAAFAFFAVFATPHAAFAAPPEMGRPEKAVDSAVHGIKGDHGGVHGEGGHSEAPRAVFDPEHGTWFNGIARTIFAQPGERGPHGPAVKYDFLVITALLWTFLGLLLVSAARKVKIRPEGKPASVANMAEAAVAGFQDYLVGVMGAPLARKYTPLIASFFFTILVSNYLGLVPGMLAPTAMPAIPIALALVAFIAVHVIAISEAGFKSWFMHFVGEPIWL
ncbi:MAG: F0F1 ATP synthase subunit A, partial [Armatimonadetes bacterium]|nr:F0F1 ATP synthase subunit A [Armatimonadota bacterium]